LSKTESTIFILVKLKAHQQKKMEVGLTALHGSQDMGDLYSAVASSCVNRREYKCPLLPNEHRMAILNFEFRWMKTNRDRIKKQSYLPVLTQGTDHVALLVTLQYCAEALYFGSIQP